jgi:K+-sensing histidine kinase KdpD
MSPTSDKETVASGDRAYPYLRKEYIDTVAHDLRSPLVSGVQILELIMTGAVGPVPEDALRLLGLLKEEQQKALQMVTSLIEIYRLETGAAPLAVAAANLSEILAGAIFNCKKECEKKQITIANKCDDSYQALVDLKWTSKAINILMTNCLDHTEPGSTINTEISSQNNHCTIKLDFSSFTCRNELQAIFSDYDPNNSYKYLTPPARLELRLCADILTHQKGNIELDGKAPSELAIVVNLPAP